MTHADDGSPPKQLAFGLHGTPGAWQMHLGRRHTYLAKLSALSSQNSTGLNPQVLEAVLVSGPASGWTRGVDEFPASDAVKTSSLGPCFFRDNRSDTGRWGLPDGISPDNPMSQQFVNSFLSP